MNWDQVKQLEERAEAEQAALRHRCTDSSTLRARLIAAGLLRERPLDAAARALLEAA